MVLSFKTFDSDYTYFCYTYSRKSEVLKPVIHSSWAGPALYRSYAVTTGSNDQPTSFPGGRTNSPGGRTYSSYQRRRPSSQLQCIASTEGVRICNPNLQSADAPSHSIDATWTGDPGVKVAAGQVVGAKQYKSYAG